MLDVRLKLFSVNCVNLNSKSMQKFNSHLKALYSIYMECGIFGLIATTVLWFDST